MNKLKEERIRYVEFQGIERELEHSKRIHLAWKYVAALNNSQKTEEDVKIVQNKIDTKFENIAAGQEEIKNIEAKYIELLKKKEAVWFLFFFCNYNIIFCDFLRLLGFVIKVVIWDRANPY